ncbi:asparagine synthetase B family protein [Pseudoalteromonas aurantia]|nr:asparagine synthase-related protein [Pseudoalteromonas aurantia]TMO67085.1 asparagine synthetase B family protein [Pseudoalteromonas aurantia]
MPGIVGFFDEEISYCHSAGQTAFTNEFGFYSQLLKTQTDNVACKQLIHLDLKITIWGDVFSIANLDIDVDAFLVRLAQVYRQDTLASFMSSVNGYFVISIVDTQQEHVTYISDRYGMKPLYLWYQGECVKGAASEQKELLLHTKHDRALDNEALNCFVDVGHFLGQKTLFSSVKRLAPATIMQLDACGVILSNSQFWSWKNIEKTDKISFDDAVDLIAVKFDKAVERAVKTITQDKLAITLSGGLDSRVLLAAAKVHYSGEIHTFTFGEPGCIDVKLAKQVSEAVGVTHHIVEIDEQGWFDGREQGVWLTDGMKNVLHMHALSSVNVISGYSNYLLNGFLGDVTAGGTYIFPKSNDSIEQKLEKRFGQYWHQAGADSDYFAEGDQEQVNIYNRGTRFIAAGSDLLSHELHQFKPFMDNDLVELLYSLPDTFRENGKLYHHMLLKYYPEYFESIPWQQTGKPITKEVASAAQHPNMKSRIKDLLVGSPIERLARKVYRKLAKKHHYVAYDTWLKEPKFKLYVQQLLNEDSHVAKALPTGDCSKLVDKYYNSSSSIKPETLGSLITIELFLRQLEHSSLG